MVVVGSAAVRPMLAGETSSNGSDALIVVFEHQILAIAVSEAGHGRAHERRGTLIVPLRDFWVNWTDTRHGVGCDGCDEDVARRYDRVPGFEDIRCQIEVLMCLADRKSCIWIRD